MRKFLGVFNGKGGGGGTSSGGGSAPNTRIPSNAPNRQVKSNAPKSLMGRIGAFGGKAWAQLKGGFSRGKKVGARNV